MAADTKQRVKGPGAAPRSQSRQKGTLPASAKRNGAGRESGARLGQGTTGPKGGKGSEVHLAPDLIAVLAAMQRLKCSMKPTEIAEFAHLPRGRSDAALEELAAAGLVEIHYWKMTPAGKAVEA